jgi:hypothetical protein
LFDLFFKHCSVFSNRGELGYCFLEKGFELVGRHFDIDSGFVLDGFSSHTESKGREGFRFVVACGRTIDDEGRTGVSSE